MTPFGEKIRKLRQDNNIQLKEMAENLKISSAYLSALEHGKRGKPAPGLIMQIADYFNLIWDDVDELKELADVSHPRVVVDTSGMSPKATLLANLIARHIGELDEKIINQILLEMGFDEFNVSN